MCLSQTRNEHQTMLSLLIFHVIIIIFFKINLVIRHGITRDFVNQELRNVLLLLKTFMMTEAY